MEAEFERPGLTEGEGGQKLSGLSICRLGLAGN